MAFLQPDRGTQSQRTQRKDVVRSGQLFAAGADGNGRDRSLGLVCSATQDHARIKGFDAVEKLLENRLSLIGHTRKLLILGLSEEARGR
jgi:hypothetical protein